MRNQRMKSVMDGNLVRREYYNPNSFPVFFERMLTKDEYVTNAGIQLGPYLVRIDPKKHAILNHAFYVASAADHELFELITIYGDQIGKGLTRPVPMKTGVRP